LGPTRDSSTMFDVVENSTMATVKGTNATPLTSGE
jgi:hypothetical protein